MAGNGTSSERATVGNADGCGRATVTPSGFTCTDTEPAPISRGWQPWLGTGAPLRFMDPISVCPQNPERGSSQ